MPARALSWRVIVPAVLVVMTGSGAAALHGQAPPPAIDAAPVLDATAPAIPKPAFQAVRTGTLIRTADPRSRLTRTGLDLWEVSRTTSFDVPEAALRAYRHAAGEESACGVPWWLLAGIGRVESDHGRYGGATLDSEGVSHPTIIGVALDGHGPVALIHDTDDGTWDRDTVWDHAVGPMQFIPSTWAWAARDGDGDGVASPNDLDDAALAAAAYLCRYGPLTSEEAMRTAVFHYNQSEYYVDLVLAFGHGYDTGYFEIPSPPALHEAPADSSHGTSAAPAAPATSNGPATTSQPSTSGQSGPTSQTTALPSSPTSSTPTDPATTDPPTTSPTVSPTPDPTGQPTATPVLVARTGTWDTCPSGWCLDGTTLDLGTDTQYDATAAADYDGDGAVELVREEFAGLVGTIVTVQVASGTDVVHTIRDLAYRNADGSFVS